MTDAFLSTRLERSLRRFLLENHEIVLIAARLYGRSGGEAEAGQAFSNLLLQRCREGAYPAMRTLAGMLPAKIDIRNKPLLLAQAMWAILMQGFLAREAGGAGGAAGRSVVCLGYTEGGAGELLPGSESVVGICGGR